MPAQRILDGAMKYILSLKKRRSASCEPSVQAMTAVFAQLERRLIAQRTKEAPEAARRKGVRLGRPPVVPDAVRSVVLRLHSEERWSARRIATHLQHSGIEAPHGGTRWHASTVTRIVAQSGGEFTKGHPTTSKPPPA
jgi:DNA invertase Pin-like site-specific DNA recombinase